jgi:hypothetical protein
MLQVDNRSALKFSLGVFPNEDGIECVYGVAKATFVVDAGGKAELCDEQEELVLVDEPWGDPLASSLKTASEMMLVKPATDVLLRGLAHAPGGKATQVDVSLRVGPIQKTIRVFGDRVWEQGVLGYKASEPKPFDRIPLVYERAFGGTDPQPIDGSKVEYEPRNPIGRGLVPRNSRVQQDGLPLPNLEDPSHLIRSLKDRPTPAGFGPIPGHWEPRKSYAGTYDEAWTTSRAPYLPLDFNRRFFQVAPPGQIAEGYLKGGEPVEIRNATPSGRLSFPLPICSPELVFHFDGRDHRHVPNLDTVSIDPESGRLWMIWRTCLVVDKKLLRMTAVQVSCPEYPKRKEA